MNEFLEQFPINISLDQVVKGLPDKALLIIMANVINLAAKEIKVLNKQNEDLTLATDEIATRLQKSPGLAWDAIVTGKTINDLIKMGRPDIAGDELAHRLRCKPAMAKAAVAARVDYLRAQEEKESP